MSLWILTALWGCAAKAPSLPVAPVDTPPPLAAEAAPHGAPWTHAVYADHPLVGTIVRTADGATLTEGELVAELEPAAHVLLGEKHDNADHHRLQGALIARLDPSAVAFEQLNDDQDPAGLQTAQAVAEQVRWADSGWPDFALYEPVFAAALQAGSTLVPAHPAKPMLFQAMKEGVDSLDPATLDGLRLDRTLDDAQRQSLADEVVDAHCGHADEGTVAMMVTAQRLKDTWMARALTEAGPGSVLIAGTGHTRTDRGVPLYLDGAVKVVAFREVIAGETDPASYGEPADYVWFTPRVEDVDPCETFREQLEKMGH